MHPCDVVFGTARTSSMRVVVEVHSLQGFDLLGIKDCSLMYGLRWKSMSVTKTTFVHIKTCTYLNLYQNVAEIESL